MMRISHRGWMTAAAVAVWASACCSGAEPAPDAKPSACEAAVKEAAAANKHLYVFVHSEDNEATRSARTFFEAAMAAMADVAQWTALRTDAPAEKAFVDRLRLKAGSTPWIVVFAPNGAVTMSGRAVNISEEKLRAGIAGPCEQKCLKVLQEKKILLLCAYDKTVKDDDPSVKAVNEFMAGAYGTVIKVVRADPADTAEARFFKQMGIDPQRSATTVVIVPPKRPLETIPGLVTKARLDAAMERYMAEDG